MKNEILTHLNDPSELEKLYRNNKAPFAQEFRSIYPELKGNQLADFWNERLRYESDDISWGTGRDLLLVFLASLAAGFIAKMPAYLPIEEEFFLPQEYRLHRFPASHGLLRLEKQTAGKQNSLVSWSYTGNAGLH